MTTIHRTLDAQLTGKRGTIWSVAKNAIVSLFVRYRNRRQVLSLNEFNDHQLADIGLTRDDVRFALRGGAFNDHSMDLMRASLRRRSRMTAL
ncbi:DUF1127 domain-containing protein [Hoeflea poritis]|uniref:DUF1127 domain-containing protein n=1 Tax=Hoeflea poritis TaxID=2993659 RepID=A0ABT4VSA5_9HYPH|nr:DUF1127 domain-containing protein [Hoeflea poritis]MDA4847595.1 DUF1127 domain-containing protein [Hoeflea poritis]